MKKLLITAFSLSALLMVPGLRADEAPSGGTGGGGQGMMAKLGLSADQMAKIKTIRESHQAAMKADREKVEADLKKLSDDLSSKAADSALTADLSTLKTDREASMQEMTKQMEEVAAILTPTQQAQGAIARGAGMEGGMGMGGRRGGQGEGQSGGQGGQGGN